MPIVKVTGTNFVRDTNSMALMNTDENSKNEYYAKVRMLKTQKDEINKVKSEMLGIKDDMAEIKYMLSKLLKEGSNG
jgi:hypothetical protein